VKKAIKVIRKDSPILRSELELPDVIFYYQDIQVDQWRIQAW